MNKLRDVTRIESQEHWSNYFQLGWEKNNGRNQTRLFAEAFAKHTRIDRLSCKSLLDSSCALGDAFPVLHNIFPNATLFGSDFSEVAINRCKAEYGNLGSFSVKSIENIEGYFDVIFSSATLEHFTDYQQKSRILLSHCKYLCILVPYNEQRLGRDLSFKPENDHVVTFRQNSFDYLVKEGVAEVVTNIIFRVPGAWSWTLKDYILQPIKNIIRLLLGRPLVWERKMILFEIKSSTSI